MWQFSAEPDLQRSSQAQRATADVRQVVRESGLAQLVKADAQFTRADISEPIWKEVESLESVMIPCLAPDGQRGASWGSQTIAGQQIAGGCATTVT
jgi:hypothetical protein